MYVGVGPPPPGTAGRAAPAHTPLPARRPRMGRGGLEKWASVPSPPCKAIFFPPRLTAPARAEGTTIRDVPWTLFCRKSRAVLLLLRSRNAYGTTEKAVVVPTVRIFFGGLYATRLQTGWGPGIMCAAVLRDEVHAHHPPGSANTGGHSPVPCPRAPDHGCRNRIPKHGPWRVSTPTSGAGRPWSRATVPSHGSFVPKGQMSDTLRTANGQHWVNRSPLALCYSGPFRGGTGEAEIPLQGTAQGMCLAARRYSAECCACPCALM